MKFATKKRGKKKFSTTHLTKRRSKRGKRRSRVRRRSRPFGNSVTAQPGQWGGGAKEDGQGPLPEGWKCKWDNEKRRYLYYNREHNLTQWQRPTLSALDAFNLKQEKSSKTKEGEGRDLKKLNEQLQMERHAAQELREQQKELIRKEEEAKAELNRVLHEMEDLKRKLNECKEEEEAEEEGAEEKKRPLSIKERGEELQKKGLMGLGVSASQQQYRPLRTARQPTDLAANELEEAPKKLTNHPTSNRAGRGRRTAPRRKRRKP